ncbi:MAG: thiamine pyrophosphate-binding protein [Terracidiphilus sp.]|nr:thiamine pyrophosphate-binding protein [Terracidiphilus sp.]
MKYSDQIADWLTDLGYTHCFFVTGGNIMHLVESFSHKLTCIPVVHEVAAGIAVEYFNEVAKRGRALALVTAGPGLTNIVTAMAGAFLESRELLVLGGQVKRADLARGEVRQRGVQEVDGVSIAKSVAIQSALMDEAWTRKQFCNATQAGCLGRKGPIFLEIPLDVQALDIDSISLNEGAAAKPEELFSPLAESDLEELKSLIAHAKRPVILIGGGIARETTDRLMDQLATLGIPLMVTLHGLDRIYESHPMFFGRPNIWGQRSANIVQQQADLLVALGTRLSLQQTGFNWQEFMPIGKVVHVDCDPKELHKGHPRVDLAICGDANKVLDYIVQEVEPNRYKDWVAFCREVRELVPLDDPQNKTKKGYLSPYQFCLRLSERAIGDDVVIPCSSGGAYTIMHQTFQYKRGQRGLHSGALASMGYGLSAAIGAAIASQGKRTILVEGDGGFLQNLQELGTVAMNHLNMKIFLFDNHGYASIRATQRSYFQGHYVGCDNETGLYTPRWEKLFAAYDIPLLRITKDFEKEKEFLQLFSMTGPAGFIVNLDPDQTYFPKITSRITTNGMESNPLHQMSPELPPEIAEKVFRYF